VGSPYEGVEFGEPIAPTPESEAMFNTLVQGMQNTGSGTGPRIMLDDFGNPIGQNEIKGSKRNKETNKGKQIKETNKGGNK